MPVNLKVSQVFSATEKFSKLRQKLNAYLRPSEANLSDLSFEEKYFAHVSHGQQGVGAQKVTSPKHQVQVRLPILVVSAHKVIVTARQTQLRLIQLENEEMKGIVNMNFFQKFALI